MSADLFLANGAVINFNNGDYTPEHEDEDPIAAEIHRMLGRLVILVLTTVEVVRSVDQHCYEYEAELVGLRP